MARQERRDVGCRFDSCREHRRDIVESFSAPRSHLAPSPDPRHLSEGACAIELGPRLSYLGAVLAVMDHIPRDQRPAQRRDEPERGQRRERQGGGDKRQHADRRGEPARTDPAWPLRRRAADQVKRRFLRCYPARGRPMRVGASSAT